MCFICDMSLRHDAMGDVLTESLRATRLAMSKQMLKMESNEIKLLTVIAKLVEAIESDRHSQKLAVALSEARAIFGDLQTKDVFDALEKVSKLNAQGEKILNEGQPEQPMKAELKIVEMNSSDVLKTIEEILGLKPKPSDKSKH